MEKTTVTFRILTPLAIAALALGATACGGDDKLSKEEFAKKAEAICKEYENKVEAVEEPQNAQDADDAAQYLDEVTPIVEEGVAKLKDLEPPEDVKSDWDDYIESSEQGTKLLKESAEKANAKDPSGLQDLQQLDAITAKGKAAAKKVGATGCADSS